jgi:glycosyltransferase involved in cell wall biosynthesis
MSEVLPEGFARWHRAQDGFDPRSYFLANPDVRIFSNAQQLHDHWRLHGLQEVRPGSGVSPYVGRRPWSGVLSNVTLKVAFYGPISALSGLGSAARGYIAALSSLHIDLEVIDTTASLYPEKQGSIAAPSTSPDVIILHQNPDSLGNLFRLIDRKLLDGVYTIGIWVWEVMAFPSEWLEAFDAVDEVWTPSAFVTDAIEAAAPFDIPVRTIPHVVEAPSCVVNYQRSDFGIPENAFAFLCAFDASSALERKNPVTVLEAFVEAFENDPAAFLVMKFHSGDNEAAKIAAIRREYSASNILFLDVLMPSEELAALKQLTDCLVSAHRSEGFGLNIAEAMAAGKPVIATDYSGNLLFCNETNSLLVSARLCEVEEGTRHYPAGSVWAQPDHQSLVSAMRRLVADRGLEQALGHQAAETVRNDLGHERIAALIAHSLEQAKRRGEQVQQKWQKRSKLAWRHPGALGSDEFAQGKWPTFSLIVAVRDTAPAVLDKQINSILGQTYPYWELCICGDASIDAQTLAYLDALRGRDQRIRIRRFARSAGASLAVNAAVEIATGEFLTLVDLDQAIEPETLATYAFAIAANPDCAILCGSEEENSAHETHMLTIRKRLFLEISDFGCEYASDQQRDIRCRIERGGGQIVRVARRVP